jgi:hypothetical protein
MQANRHDGDADAFTNDFVLNRLGMAADEETLEASKNLRAGKTLPGAQPGNPAKFS